MSLTKSYPFIPGLEVFTFDANGKMMIDESFKDLKEDKSYQKARQLYERIYAKDLDGFIKIYIEYVNDPSISDFFKHDEEEHDFWFHSYPYCRCVTRDDEPERIHRHMYVRQCNCSNGKRYLAYLCAYNAQQDETTYYYDTSCNESNKNISDIQQYLLDDGPIDLKYTNLLYNGTSDLKYTNLVYNKNK